MNIRQISSIRRFYLLLTFLSMTVLTAGCIEPWSSAGMLGKWQKTFDVRGS